MKTVFLLAFMPVLTATPVVNKATGIVSSIGNFIGGIFGGGKNYVSAGVGIFGGGGQRFGKSGDINQSNWAGPIGEYHYVMVIQRLGFQNVSSPSKDQINAFWAEWDRSGNSDADAFRNLSTDQSQKSFTAGPQSGSLIPILILGGAILIAFGFLAFGRRR